MKGWPPLQYEPRRLSQHQVGHKVQLRWQCLMLRLWPYRRLPASSRLSLRARCANFTTAQFRASATPPIACEVGKGLTTG